MAPRRSGPTRPVWIAAVAAVAAIAPTPTISEATIATLATRAAIAVGWNSLAASPTVAAFAGDSICAICSFGSALAYISMLSVVTGVAVSRFPLFTGVSILPSADTAGIGVATVPTITTCLTEFTVAPITALAAKQCDLLQPIYGDDIAFHRDGSTVASPPSGPTVPTVTRSQIARRHDLRGVQYEAAAGASIGVQRRSLCDAICPVKTIAGSKLAKDEDRLGGAKRDAHAFGVIG